MFKTFDHYKLIENCKLRIVNYSRKEVIYGKNK